MALFGHLKEKHIYRIHPEAMVDRFSQMDCDITYYSFIRSIYLRYGVKDVLDYGAGRNRYEQDFDADRDSFLIRDLRDLRFGDAAVTAADLSEAVKSHPTSARQVQLKMDEPLPFTDQSFDLIVSDFVFEHVRDPKAVTAELQRVLRPGGWMAIRTPNVLGYMTWIAALTPNRLHNAALHYVQPDRKELDTFPTYYRVNSRRAVSRYFDQCEVAVASDSWEPAYFFGNVLLYRLFLILHKIMPRAFGTASMFFLRKKDG
jgi:SAM-dependent methyltransferase